MAQPMVTEFFSTRKRNADSQPSKRRKVLITSSEVDIGALDITNTNSFRNQLQVKDSKDGDAETEEKVFSPIQTRASRASKSKPTTKSTVKAVTTRVRKANVDPKQKSIHDAFKYRELMQPDGKTTLTDLATSSWDEHDGPALTPSKADTKQENGRKRTRHEKSNPTTEEGEATPEKRPTSAKLPPPKSETKAKKRLQLKSKENTDKSKENDECSLAVPLETEKLILPKTPPPISPLPPTPENIKPVEKNTKQVQMSDKVRKALEKCKTLSAKPGAKAKAVNMDALKEKLSKCNKLEALKDQLSKMKETSAKISVKAPQLKTFKNIEVEVEVPSDVKTTVPAYERFHSLASKAPPALNIPYKYKVLAETFRGMDTVVSMLHNRNELCTFSKLKAAVQELNKKNFELTHVGQVKTVFPEAYVLRQEKGLAMFGNKKSSRYQLTVQANLEMNEKPNGGRSNFAASHLLTRRNVFHNSLIKIVMKQHQEFLSKLDPPMSVPDDKITRWHPKFPLDSMADIIPSYIPEAPSVKMFTSAKDVLIHQKGKISPRIEKALTAVMQETTTEVKEMPAPVPKPPPTTAAHKGIPLSLLEKIRAKEAKNTVKALTRDPKVEKRIVMMKRLPEIMRIMRTHFVTEKKPSLPMDNMIQKLVDSYKSCISTSDVDEHVKLAVELFPEWLTVISIQKGKYLKINKSLDLQVLSDKIQNILKTQK